MKNPKHVFSPTLFMLMATHGSGPTVKLEDITEHYFGISPRTAQARATAGKLPVPAFRVNQKSPYLVHLVDLAQYIDDQRQTAIDRMNEMSMPGEGGFNGY